MGGASVWCMNPASTPRADASSSCYACSQQHIMSVAQGPPAVHHRCSHPASARSSSPRSAQTATLTEHFQRDIIFAWQGGWGSVSGGGAFASVPCNANWHKFSRHRAYWQCNAVSGLLRGAREGELTSVGAAHASDIRRAPETPR